MKQEQVYNIVLFLKENGMLSDLIRAGLVTSKIAVYAEIYCEVEAMKRRYKRKTQSMIIIELADKMRLHPTTIYRALSVMKQPLQNCAKQVK